MQLLIFNTKQKTIELRSDFIENNILYFSSDDISTVSVRDGYYEIMKKLENQTVPIARFPISNTNMLII